MDRTTALRLERIRLAAEATHRLVDLLVRRHVAVLVVALTVFASALAAGASGQLPLSASAAAALGSGGTVAVLLRKLRSLGEEDWVASMEAVAGIDNLIGEQHEPLVDEEESDAGAVG